MTYNEMTLEEYISLLPKNALAKLQYEDDQIHLENYKTMLKNEIEAHYIEVRKQYEEKKSNLTK